MNNKFCLHHLVPLVSWKPHIIFARLCCLGQIIYSMFVYAISFWFKCKERRIFYSLWMPVRAQCSRLIVVVGTDTKVAKSPGEPWDLSQTSREVLGPPQTFLMQPMALKRTPGQFPSLDVQLGVAGDALGEALQNASTSKVKPFGEEGSIWEISFVVRPHLVDLKDLKFSLKMSKLFLEF